MICQSSACGQVSWQWFPRIVFIVHSQSSQYHLSSNCCRLSMNVVHLISKICGFWLAATLNLQPFVEVDMAESGTVQSGIFCLFNNSVVTAICLNRPVTKKCRPSSKSLFKNITSVVVVRSSPPRWALQVATIVYFPMSLQMTIIVFVTV